MGSVKDLVTEGLAGQLYIPPGPHKFGRGAWKVSGRFSVADLKHLIPDVEIPEKNFVLAMTAGRYWEAASENGIKSCYLGMMDNAGKIVDTQTLLDRGELSDVVVMELANTPKGKKDGDIRAYHQAIKDRDITVYVADAESIFRLGFPLGSSVFKGIFKLTGRKGIYETLATYNETVKELDAIRRDVQEKGIGTFSGLKEYLAGFKLEGIPNPGHVLSEPVYDFTTKFAIGGDTAITPEEARLRMGLNEQGYGAWKEMVKACASHQIRYCDERKIVNIDGKVEAVGVEDKVKFTDFGCTGDENRLMVICEQDDVKYLVPSNKEIQRAIFRANGVYVAVERAKKQYGDDWHNHFFEFFDETRLRETTTQSCEMMGNAIGMVGNLLLGKEVFKAKPVAEWVAPFLPYASRVQERVA